MVTHKELMDQEVEHMKTLKGKYRHFCDDWDFMAIDETYEQEFECCTCDKEQILKCNQVK